MMTEQTIDDSNDGQDQNTVFTARGGSGTLSMSGGFKAYEIAILPEMHVNCTTTSTGLCRYRVRGGSRCPWLVFLAYIGLHEAGVNGPGTYHDAGRYGPREH